MKSLRIIDANGNRAREALRVMEEAARFVLDDAELTQDLKSMRHRLAAALTRLDGLHLHRDVPADVGTEITLEGERSRASVAEVATAAGRRLGEALRAVEEYGKIHDPAFAAEVERMRYLGYDLEQRLDRALGGGRAPQWRVCVLLGEAVCPGGDWRRVAGALAAALPPPDCVQLREKTLPDRALLDRARELRRILPRATALVVNDRPDVALLAGADGVHLGPDDLPCREVRAHVGRRLLIGVSTSRLDEARQALADGADSCGVGPMYATATKRKDVVGPAYLRAYVAWGRLPHLAIGGITPANVGALVDAGAQGVAVSTAVCSAEDPGAVVAALHEALADREAAVAGSGEPRA